MYVMKRSGTIVALLVVMGSLLAGPSPATDPPKGITGNPENQLKPVEGPFKYTSQEGDFRIIWPSGCSNLKTRTPADDDLGGDDSYYSREYPVVVNCNRNGEEGEGCSVTAIFNPRDQEGQPAGPSEVTARLQNVLQQFGAEVKAQMPLRKDFGGGLVIEGLDVQAAQTGGSGQVWLRGLMVGGDIYLLAAWDIGGRVWKNPEYATFFNSFEPGTE